MGSSDRDGHDDTVPEDASPPRTTARPSLPGYDIAKLLGAGGMGEVVLARDARIGRDVAIKRMRAAAPSRELVERFLREAKVQARLDHPAIVPVYELGTDAEGQPYFTMKRVAGTTLAARLAERGPMQPLLRALIDVCHAIEFAHARGVVHRDLKPANIILGDYGEVYVLDWGVARVIARATALTPAVGTPSIAADTQTQAGALLGTPGYMAPEQARGEVVGTPADVYALGCILFEILAGEPLHPPGAEAFASTLAAAAQRPSARRPDRAIPVELDDACLAALAPDRDARPTAGELAARVQRYLDGDRDGERRAALAAELVARARANAGAPERRAEAIRDAGRAVALDPASQDAVALVMRLLLERPARLPDALRAHLDRAELVVARDTARYVPRVMLLVALLVPLALWAGVSPISVAALLAIAACGALDAHLQARRARPTYAFTFVFAPLAVILMTRLFSPLVFAPLVALGTVVGLGNHPQVGRRPWLVVSLGLGALALAFLLEAAGVLAPTWGLDHGKLVIASRVVQLHGAAGYASVLAVNALALAALAGLLQRVLASHHASRELLEIQAWHLRHLLPAAPAERAS